MNGKFIVFVPLGPDGLPPWAGSTDVHHLGNSNVAAAMQECMKTWARFEHFLGALEFCGFSQPGELPEPGQPSLVLLPEAWVTRDSPGLTCGIRIPGWPEEVRMEVNSLLLLQVHSLKRALGQSKFPLDGFGLFRAIWESGVWDRTSTIKFWRNERYLEFQACFPPWVPQDSGSSAPIWKAFFDRFPEIQGLALSASNNPYEALWLGNRLEGALTTEGKGLGELATVLLPMGANPWSSEEPYRLHSMTQTRRIYSLPCREGGPQLYLHLLMDTTEIRTRLVEALQRHLETRIEFYRQFGTRVLENLHFEQVYSRSAFEKNLRRMAESLQAFICYAPEEAGVFLRRLAIQYSRYVRENFGARLNPGFQEGLDAMLSTGLSTESPQDRSDPEVLRQARFLARALGIAMLLSEEDADPETPSGLLPGIAAQGRAIPVKPWLGGRVRPEERPYQILFLQMFLLDCVGSSPLLSLLVHVPLFKSTLLDVIAPGRDAAGSREGNEPAELEAWLHAFVKGLENRAHRIVDMQPLDAPPCGPSKKPMEDSRNKEPDPASLLSLHDYLCRWLHLSVVLELNLQEGRELVVGGAKGNLSQLWEVSEDLLWRWLWFHKQWNAAPRILDETATQGLRRKIWEHLSGQARRQTRLAAAVGTSGTFHLHIDSLWLHLYLLWGLFHRIPWHNLRTIDFPNEYLAGAFIHRMADLMSCVLWSLIQHEQDPEAFAFLPPLQENGPMQHPMTGAGTEPGGPPLDSSTEGRLPFPQKRPRGPMDRVVPILAPRYTEVLIDLVDVYAHHVLHVPDEIHVGRYLRSALESHAALYSLKQYYRDHLFHVIDVFLLGDFLLRCHIGQETEFVRTRFERHLGLDKEEHAAKEGSSEFHEKNGYDLLLQNWGVAGLFHDVGYVWLLCGAVPSNLKGDQGGILGNFLASMKMALEGNLKNLEATIPDAYQPLAGCEGKLGRDHGFFSALVVQEHLKHLDYSQDEKRLLRRFLPALQAIFLHNLSHQPVHFQKHPLAYLLALCDEIQDWGRHQSPPGHFSQDVAIAGGMQSNWQFRLAPVLTELVIACEGANGDAVVLKAAGNRYNSAELQLEFYLAYRPADDDLMDPLILWTRKAMNLERLHSDGFTRIRLHITTRVPDRFRRMSINNKMLFNRVADRAQELNLARFVHLLELMGKADTNSEHALDLPRTGHGIPGPEGDGDRFEQPDQGPFMDLAREERNYEVDRVVLDLEALCRAHPLRAFDAEDGFRMLANTKKEILREIEERHRFFGRFRGHTT